MVSVNILSIFVAIAMALTGGYFAEDPNAYAARSLRFSEIVVTIDGESYPLDVQPTLSAVTENGSALFDFHMPMGEHDLFPVQAKINADGGASVMLGKDANVYTFAPELISAGMDGVLPESYNAVIESYMRLLSVSADMQNAVPDAAALEEKYNAWLTENVSTMITEETTIELGGETLPATRKAYALDSLQLPVFVDFVYDAIAPGFADAFFDYMGALAAMDETFSMSVPTNFSELFSLSGLQMSAEIEETLTEDGRGYGSALLHMSIDTGDEMPAAVTIPIEIVSYGSDEAEITLNTEIALEDGSSVDLAAEISIAGKNSVIVTEVFSGEELAFMMAVGTAVDEDGSIDQSVDYGISVEGVSFSMVILNNSDAAGNGSSTLSANIDDLYGLTMKVDVFSEPIADRIASAEPILVSTPEELEEAGANLSFNLMALLGDVEKLMTNESVANLVSAVEALVPEEAASVAIISGADEETYDSSVPFEEGSAEDLSFPVPEFTWLPEGYEQTEAHFYPEFDNADFWYEYTGTSDEYYPPISVSIYAAESEIDSYTLTDGGLTLIEQPIVSIERYDEDVYVTATIEGATMHISLFGGMSDEEIASLLNGVVYTDAAMEAEADGFDVVLEEEPAA